MGGLIGYSGGMTLWHRNALYGATGGVGGGITTEMLYVPNLLGKGISVTGQYAVGGLIGYAVGLTSDGVTLITQGLDVTGEQKDTKVKESGSIGGLYGYIKKSTLLTGRDFSSFTCGVVAIDGGTLSVSGTTNVGGVVGTADASTVDAQTRNSLPKEGATLSTVSIGAHGAYPAAAGGVVGRLLNSHITIAKSMDYDIAPGTYVQSGVSIWSSTTEAVGGLAGLVEMTQASGVTIPDPSKPNTGVIGYTVNGTHYADYTVGLVRSGSENKSTDGYKVEFANQDTRNWAADIDAAIFETKYKANYTLGVCATSRYGAPESLDKLDARKYFSRFGKYEFYDAKQEKYIIAYNNKFPNKDIDVTTAQSMRKDGVYSKYLQTMKYPGTEVWEGNPNPSAPGDDFHAHNIFNGIYSEGMPAKNATNTVKGYNSTFTVKRNDKEIIVTHKGSGQTYYGPGPDGVKGTEDDVYTSKVTVTDAVFGNQNNGKTSSVLADGTPVSVGNRPYDAGKLTGLNMKGWVAEDVSDKKISLDDIKFFHKWTTQFRVRANPSVYTLYNYRGKTDVLKVKYGGFVFGVSSNSLTFKLNGSSVNILDTFSGGTYMQHSIALTFNIREFRYSNLNIVLI